jgi:glycerol-3-phosphate acyltransferase PlsX
MDKPQKIYRIALDAMGGDFAPMNEIQGAVNAYSSKSPNLDFEIVFVGQEKKIKSAMNQLDMKNLNYSIVNADEIVTMEDDPTIALKKKKNSSLYKGLELHTQGYVDAFISAGNTGAVLATATVLLGRIKGVSRPTIGSFFPSDRDLPVLVLDVGANVDCKARFLYEFAVMGSIYFRNMYNIENPRVGLLSIGEEESKGNEIVLETFAMLKESNLNFIGNVEGRDILHAQADVIICDGFTGNIVLKFAESVLGFIKTKFKTFANKNIFNKIIMASFYPIFKKIFQDMDYQKYGGVPLLGVNGVTIIGHGKSSPLAIQNMINRALEQCQKDINEKIELALNPQNMLQKTND